MTLTETQQRLLWNIIDAECNGEMDVESLTDFYGFQMRTINSLGDKELLSFMTYANGDYVTLTDLAYEYLNLL